MTSKLMTRTDVTDAVEAFDLRYGSVIRTALQVYAEKMRETAGEADAAAPGSSRAKVTGTPAGRAP